MEKWRGLLDEFVHGLFGTNFLAKQNACQPKHYAIEVDTKEILARSSEERW